MTVKVPRWFAVAFVALLAAGLGVGVTLLVTSHGSDGSGASAQANPATSADELAQIESAVNNWEVIFAGTSDRARTCGQEARNGTVDRATCYAEEVRGKVDDASEELALPFADTPG